MSPTRTARVLVLLGGLALAASASARPAPVPQPAADVEVVTLAAVHAVVLPMKGSYLQHPDAFARLGRYLAEKGVAPAGPPFGRYFSDPSVGEENLVWEVGFPIADDVTVEAPFELRDEPSTLAAVHVHQGPMEGLGTAWGTLVQWVVANGYQPVGPARQVFKGDMAAAPDVEIQLPVSK